MGVADELFEDSKFLADKGLTDRRQTLMRRSISTAYDAAFHLFIEDFVEHWEFPSQRARLGRMFGHTKLRGFTPKDKKNPTPLEEALQSAVAAFAQLQKDHERADYDSAWRLVETDVRDAIRLSEEVFAK